MENASDFYANINSKYVTVQWWVRLGVSSSFRRAHLPTTRSLFLQSVFSPMGRRELLSLSLSLFASSSAGGRRSIRIGSLILFLYCCRMTLVSTTAVWTWRKTAEWSQSRNFGSVGAQGSSLVVLLAPVRVMDFGCSVSVFWNEKYEMLICSH